MATAADEGYFEALRNLVGSLRAHGAGPGRAVPAVLVYDLGLTPAQRWEAARWCNVSLPWMPDALQRFAAVAPHVADLQVQPTFSWEKNMAEGFAAMPCACSSPCTVKAHCSYR